MLQRGALWPLICVPLLLLRPLESPDFWGLLAEGRAAFSGLPPAGSLTTLTGQACGHWLGGLPWYCLWLASDFSLLQWVPLVAGFGALAVLRDSLLPWFSVPLLLVALRPGLQPCFALNGLCCFLLLQRLVRGPLRPSRILLVPCVLLVWANTAPLPVWGLFWLLTAHQGPERRRLVLLQAALSIIAVFLRPGRTAAAMADLRLLGAGLDPVWRVWQSEFPDPTATASAGAQITLLLLAAVMLTAAICHGQVFSVGRALRFVVAIAAGLLNPAHIPLAACSIVCIIPPVAASETNTVRLVSVAGAFRRVAVALVVVMSGCWLLCDACGIGGLSSSRLGWGYAQTLDLRLLEPLNAPAAAHRPRIWAADKRTAGIAAWQSSAVQLAGDPESAFREGRLDESLNLLRDLRDGHRAAYRRSDGRYGGWHRRLRADQIELLLVPVEYLTLNEELQRSTWKVIDLDSPNVLWASAESGRYEAAIRESAVQQNFVQWGAWQPDRSIYDSAGARLDVCEWAGFGPDLRGAVVQASLFRALRLPLAATRSLWPLHQQQAAGWLGYPCILRELASCQRDLAEFEWDNYGGPSRWRRLVIRALSERTENAPLAAPWPSDDRPLPSESAANLQAAATLYVAGALVGVLQVLESAATANPADVEVQYARAMVLLELGDTRTARNVLRKLLQERAPASDINAASPMPDSAVLLAAKGWLDLTSGFGGD